LVDWDTISFKRRELYLKLIELDLVGTTTEVEYPNFILNSIIMLKEQFEEKLDILKTTVVERFNSMTEY
jgi:predicted ATP-dependent Lon-type protease